MARSPRRKRPQNILLTDQQTGSFEQTNEKQLQPSPPIFDTDLSNQSYISQDNFVANDNELDKYDLDQNSLNEDDLDDDYDDEDYDDEDEIGHGEDDEEDEEFDEEEDYDEDDEYDETEELSEEEELLEESSTNDSESSEKISHQTESPKIVKASQLISNLEI